MTEKIGGFNGDTKKSEGGAVGVLEKREKRNTKIECPNGCQPEEMESSKSEQSPKMEYHCKGCDWLARGDTKKNLKVVFKGVGHEEPEKNLYDEESTPNTKDEINEEI